MTIQLPVDPAPTHVVDYTERAACIAAVVAMQPTHPRVQGHVEQARLDALQRIEEGIALSLTRGGMSREAAASSALVFVGQCVSYYSAAARA